MSMYGKHSARPRLECKDPSLAKQSEFKGTDIHEIIKRFDQTGQLPLTGREGLFIDVSTVGDYREAVELVQNAERFFMQLPAGKRAEFGNDPAAFLDFVSDPANFDQVRDLGLVPVDEDGVEIQAAPAVPPPVSDGGTAVPPPAP